MSTIKDYYSALSTMQITINKANIAIFNSGKPQTPYLKYALDGFHLLFLSLIDKLHSLFPNDHKLIEAIGVIACTTYENIPLIDTDNTNPPYSFWYMFTSSTGANVYKILRGIHTKDEKEDCEVKQAFFVFSKGLGSMEDLFPPRDDMPIGKEDQLTRFVQVSASVAKYSFSDEKYKIMNLSFMAFELYLMSILLNNGELSSDDLSKIEKIYKKCVKLSEKIKANDDDDYIKYESKSKKHSCD